MTMALTKTNTQNSTKHAEQQDVTDIQNKLYFDVVCFLEEKTFCLSQKVKVHVAKKNTHIHVIMWRILFNVQIQYVYKYNVL